MNSSMSVFSKDARQVYQASNLLDLSWLDHGFGTRHSAGWTAGLPVATARQIHSDIAVVIHEPGGATCEADALVSDRPGIFLTIRTADCIPILLADPKRRVVAAVHAGWRGTAARIAPKTVEVLQREYGIRPGDIIAAIGPGIGACCYEVGADVASHFGVQGRARIDLAGISTRQLQEAGLRLDSIHVARLCTGCLFEEFHSYRRDQSKERMVSGIGIRTLERQCVSMHVSN
jgi:YfiH family protein